MWCIELTRSFELWHYITRIESYSQSGCISEVGSAKEFS